jgi:hypothetical protein
MQPKKTPDAIVEIKLLSTEEGGRSQAIDTKVQYGCPLLIDAEYFDARFNFSSSVSPGEIAVSPVWFLSPELVVPKLEVGKRFSLWEGKIIGHGRFIEVQENT